MLEKIGMVAIGIVITLMIVWGIKIWKECGPPWTF